MPKGYLQIVYISKKKCSNKKCRVLRVKSKAELKNAIFFKTKVVHPLCFTSNPNIFCLDLHLAYLLDL